MSRQEEIIASIERTEKFQPGYPKQIVVDPRNKNAEGWQKFFDWQFNLLCDKLEVTVTPTLFDAPHTS